MVEIIILSSCVSRRMAKAIQTWPLTFFYIVLISARYLLSNEANALLVVYFCHLPPYRSMYVGYLINELLPLSSHHTTYPDIGQ